MVDSYRKVSINNLELKVPAAPLHEKIQLRIIPDKESGVSEVRFWYEDNDPWKEHDFRALEYKGRKIF